MNQMDAKSPTHGLTWVSPFSASSGSCVLMIHLLIYMHYVAIYIKNKCIKNLFFIKEMQLYKKNY